MILSMKFIKQLLMKFNYAYVCVCRNVGKMLNVVLHLSLCQIKNPTVSFLLIWNSRDTKFFRKNFDPSIL